MTDTGERDIREEIRTESHRVGTMGEPKQELRQAELASTIKTAGMLNAVQATGGHRGVQLGPTVYTHSPQSK